MEDDPRLGISGRLARSFLESEITPLLALVGLLLGLFAVIVTPREEEPQIDVTFANVFIAFPGASAEEVENLVTTKAEQVLSEIEGVEHIYSASRPGLAVLTVRFEVGQRRTEAIVRLYNALYSHLDWMPPNSGVGQPLIKPKGIDDVPILTATLWTADPQRGGSELLRVAHALEPELQRVSGTRNIYTVGGPERVVHVVLDPRRLAGYGIALDDLRRALNAGNATRDAGALVRGDEEVLVHAGTFLSTASEVAGLVVGMKNGAPIFLRDVAEVRYTADQPSRYVHFANGPAGKTAKLPAGEFAPAVTLAISKKPGTNAVDVAGQLVRRIGELKGHLIPAGVNVTITRNYGVTASDKAQTLIRKLIFATSAVVLLVFFTLGRREAIVVGSAVVLTLTVTLFASWAWGFTLNRVSLFALIFSIGILVDDAIVVVENIHRHLQIGGLPMREAIPRAVDEVGGPTILATATVIAALLPMAFVSGLMGPYMSPIPINASMGMLLSLLIAFVFTPWMSRKLVRVSPQHEESTRLQTLFARWVGPFLRGRAGRRRRIGLLAAVLTLIALSLALVAVRWVVMKMLPFDNKSEFQVVVDMPEGTTLEDTQRVLTELSRPLAQLPEVTDLQTYAGTAAPINFNGLVRQYYLRSEASQGDIQVNLVDRHARKRQSHEIALAARPQLQEIGRRFGANVKVVEVPPGPPVQAPLVAEIYGPGREAQTRAALAVRKLFESTPDIVDVDDSTEALQRRLVVSVDRQKAASLGVAQADVASALDAALRGEDMSYLHVPDAQYLVPIRMELSPGGKADTDLLGALRVRAQGGALVPLSEVATIRADLRDPTIYHKDLLPVTYVTGDMAGRLDSPLYGMASIYSKIADKAVGVRFDQYLTRQPDKAFAWSLKWDGEWQITFETFRDMGIAYSVGLVLIYLLVVAEFRSYTVPLIIMAPIPLTLIGVMPGHALLGTQFTATSMIGVIALAGIIVRNSILLVDFIQQEVRAGRPLQEAVLHAGAIRARPILLTALSAVIGAFFILDDPIFSGLAVSLIFGIMVSTLLTLLVIPVVYYAYRYDAAE